MTVPPPGRGFDASPHGPEGTLVLRGAAHGQYRPRRRQVIGGIVTLALALGLFVFILVLNLNQLHDSLRLAADLTDRQAAAQERARAYSTFHFMLWMGVLQLVIFLMNPVILFGQWSAFRRRERALADTELWLSPDHVTYACADGRFTAPSTSVRWMGFTGRPGSPGELRINVDQWGGPLQKLGSRRRPQSLFLPLAGADPRIVARSVYEATGGQVVLNA